MSTSGFQPEGYSSSAEKEYYFLQGEVGNYDQLCFKIKNWSITVSFALIGVSFFEEAPVLLLVSLFSAFAFWYTEAIWKKYQQLHINRLKIVEKNLLGEEFETGEGKPLLQNWRSYDCYRKKELKDFSSPKIHSSFASQLNGSARFKHIYTTTYCMKKTALPHAVAMALSASMLLIWMCVQVEKPISFANWFFGLNDSKISTSNP